MISFLNANNSDKFIICGSSDVSLYELKEKSNDTDFIYDCPKVHNISKSTEIFLSVFQFTHC